MRKLFITFILIFLIIFTAGCLQTNKSGDYSFKNFNSSNNQNINNASALRVNYVYPNSVSTEGKEEITIFGNGFERGDMVFIQRPEIISLEAYVYNPGYLKTWVPPHYAGSFFIGVVSPDGETAISPMMFAYTEEK